MYRSVMPITVLAVIALPLSAANVLYTFEADTYRTATDLLIADGAQGATFHSTQVDTTAANAAFGSHSLFFPPGSDGHRDIEILDTTGLGSTFTLAAQCLETEGNQTRLFSTYPGSGGFDPTQMILDIDPSGTAGHTLRAIFQTSTTHIITVTTPTFDDGEYHHVALTFDYGTVSLYLDGSMVHSDTIAGMTSYDNIVNLRVGKDTGYAPSVQYFGHIDDVVVLESVLTASEIYNVATLGAEAVLVPEPMTLALLAMGGILIYHRK